jgi:hypothetical protein
MLDRPDCDQPFQDADSPVLVCGLVGRAISGTSIFSSDRRNVFELETEANSRSVSRSI